ncbi:hypothetical protein [Synechococcus sp. PCC 7336]|uniref:hypothetical protein n=1 Tax=Synechococcus sp. PCC 7336 TaxID=195250 RepID=UPI000347AA9A|nr:hypothetical protein [Synechococcus sp. PCC 7336]
MTALSALQTEALKIAWIHLDCDWDVDGLTNELLAAYYPVFEQHRRQVTAEYRQARYEEMLEQYRLLCREEGWDFRQHLTWFEEQLQGPIRFRDLLGYRQVYPGRFFDREAIGIQICDAAFEEVYKALQELAQQDLIRTFGNVGFVLTEPGIAMARSLFFPDIRPFKQGNPFQKADELSLRRIAQERRSRRLR